MTDQVISGFKECFLMLNERRPRMSSEDAEFTLTDGDAAFVLRKDGPHMYHPRTPDEDDSTPLSSVVILLVATALQDGDIMRHVLARAAASGQAVYDDRGNPAPVPEPEDDLDTVTLERGDGALVVRDSGQVEVYLVPDSSSVGLNASILLHALILLSDEECFGAGWGLLMSEADEGNKGDEGDEGDEESEGEEGEEIDMNPDSGFRACLGCDSPGLEDCDGCTEQEDGEQENEEQEDGEQEDGKQEDGEREDGEQEKSTPAPARSYAPAHPYVETRWRHKTRGITYTVMSQGTFQGEGRWDDRSVIVYRSPSGEVLVCPETEFMDGRLEYVEGA